MPLRRPSPATARAQSRARVLVMLLSGASAGVIAALSSAWQYAPAIGWALAASVFLVWIWLAIAGLDDEQTERLATREDPSRAVTDVLILAANIASLAAIIVLMVRASHEHGAAQDVIAALALALVALSWLVVHTLFTLRYALLYYTEPIGGIDFNCDERPSYRDFAYLAFTIGMTFQVSDTNLTSSTIRGTALRHALLSYVFGSVILATTINVVVSLSTKH